MNLKIAILIAILGQCMNFLLKTLGTFSPHMFVTPMIGGPTQILLLLGNAAPLLFLIYFYRDYLTPRKVPDEQDRRSLGRATILIFLGFAVHILLQIHRMLLQIPGFTTSVYDLSPSLFNLIAIPPAKIITAAIPWINSFFVFYFFLIFLRTIRSGGHKNLRLAAQLAIAGAGINIVIRSLTFINFFLFSRGNLAFKMIFSPDNIHFTYLLPVTLFVFISLLFFLIALYRNLGETGFETTGN